MKPIIKKFSKLEKKSFVEFFEKFKAENFAVYDLYKHFTIEKHLVETPSEYFSPEKSKLGKEYYKKLIGGQEEFSFGQWVVFPWRNELYHLPDHMDLLALRTARNRGLLTWEEQLKIYNKRIALVGLSVGSGVVNSFIRSGLGNDYRISDYDTVDPHNMNRANYFLRDTGVEKIKLVIDQMYSVDPNLNVEMWNRAIDEDNIDELLDGVDLLVDCFDSFKIKMMIKKVAKKRKIPILSGFNIDRGVMVITERYDLEDDLDSSFYLNGYTEEELMKPVKNPREKTDMFVNIIGKENHSKAMLDAAYNVGDTLSGYPQLMIATEGIASSWTIVAVDILLGRSKKSIRKYIDFEKEIYS